MERLVIGCVGKPSAGKSTFLNAATEATAKVGNFPFTKGMLPTLWYGEGDMLKTECSKQNFIDPEGKCVDGTRWIPIKILDVAGLVPGAAEGRGLGNKFLDDLRMAHVLMHVIDVSGTTNEKGENTSGYDPIKDAEWLEDEIQAWIFGNLWKKWGSLKRRHSATSMQFSLHNSNNSESTALNTLQLQFSGYGANSKIVQEGLDLAGVSEPSDLETWDELRVREVVNCFIKIRFPILLVLNKIDLPSADKNIINMVKKYGQDNVVITSTLAECLLKKLKAAKLIDYPEGSFIVSTKQDLEESDPMHDQLKPIDSKNLARLEKLRDMVLYRYSGTGVQEAVNRAVELSQVVPAYMVHNVHSFYSETSGKAFQDCYLLKPGTTVREFAGALHSDLSDYLAYAEGSDGMRVSESAEITRGKNDIVRIVVTREAEEMKSKREYEREKARKAAEKESKDRKDRKELSTS